MEVLIPFTPVAPVTCKDGFLVVRSKIGFLWGTSLARGCET